MIRDIIQKAFKEYKSRDSKSHDTLSQPSSARRLVLSEPRKAEPKCSMFQSQFINQCYDLSSESEDDL